MTSATPVTPAALLRGSPLPPLEARILLTHVLGWRPTQLITRSDEALDAAYVEQFRALEARRVAGEPVAQLVGAREFFGLDFEVTPDVLIPRPETELLVDTALAAMDGMSRPRVLDLGTGTGAIAVAIASTRPDAQVWALDRSAEALAVATRNAASLLDAKRPGGALALSQSDWYDSLDTALRFDVDRQQSAVYRERRPASVGRRSALRTARRPHRRSRRPQRDPQDRRRRAGASRASGVLWIEHGYDQAEAVRELLTAQGFAQVRSERDLAGIERISGGVSSGRSLKAAPSAATG